MSDVSQPDRRHNFRARSHARVWADPGGFSVPVDCKVQDLSTTGAKIMSLEERELPDSFILHLPSHPEGREATVVWRKGKTVGVRWAKI